MHGYTLTKIPLST